MTGEWDKAAGPCHPSAASIEERAAAILRQEIADGALANIATSSRAWSESPRVARVRSELEDVVASVLDVLVQELTPPSTRMSDAESLRVLRPPQPGAPGASTEIRARLRNDGQLPVELSFACSDLLGESGQRIPAGSLALSPGVVRLPPGVEVDLAIRLDVPREARPGRYRGLLQSIDSSGLRALLTFPVT